MLTRLPSVTGCTLTGVAIGLVFMIIGDGNDL
jgi:hypothetical protein